MAQHYLHEAEYNNCAYQESRDEWRAKGNHYLASNIYDIMKDSDILPAWGVPYLTLLPLEEDPEMIAQLRAQLQEKVEELKYDKKGLENDKIELREDKKMLVDDKKMLQEEKKLLLVDKKHFQDLSLEQALKITELSQIHCNDPNHFEIIGMEMKVQTSDFE